MVSSYGLWMQFLGAVDWLARVARPGLTPVEALEEAMRWWLAGVGDPEFVATPPPVPALERDPLGAIFRLWLESAPGDVRSQPAASTLESAMRNWCEVMAREFNDGEPWPHPSPAAGWPTSLPTG